MKRVAFLSLTLSSLLFGISQEYSECNHKVYFGNGLGYDSSRKAELGDMSDIDLKAILESFKNNIYRDTKLIRGQIEYKPAINVYEDWFFGKFEQFILSFDQLFNEDFGNQYYFFSMLNYLRDGDVESNKPKPKFFNGTQERWEEIRETFIQFDLSTIKKPPAYDNPVLQEQLIDYKKNIDELGNRVAVLGHSQGAFYANLSHDVLSTDNLSGYFNVSSVGTFSSRVAGTNGNQRDGIDAWVNDESDWEVKYFGELSLNSANSNEAGHGHYMSNYLSGDESLNMLYNNLKNQILTNMNQPSRWSIIDESDEITQKGTKDYRVKLYDNSYILSDVDNVIPFGLGDSDKLYFTTIKNGANAGQKVLVKGSCEGTGVIDKTEDEIYEGGKQVLYELDGTNQKIYAEPKCDSSKPSTWSIANKYNEGTCDYRVDVTNSETGESQSGVYPFNESGYVYDVNGESVMASCGGEEVINLINDNDNSCYELSGTGEKIEEVGECGENGEQIINNDLKCGDEGYMNYGECIETNDEYNYDNLNPFYYSIYKVKYKYCSNSIINSDVIEDSKKYYKSKYVGTYTDKYYDDYTDEVINNGVVDYKAYVNYGCDCRNNYFDDKDYSVECYSGDGTSEPSTQICSGKWVKSDTIESTCYLKSIYNTWHYDTMDYQNYDRESFSIGEFIETIHYGIYYTGASMHISRYKFTFDIYEWQIKY